VSDFLRSWLTLVIFGGLAVVLVGTFLGLASLIRPARDTPQKRINYESGVVPQATCGASPTSATTCSP